MMNKIMGVLLGVGLITCITGFSQDKKWYELRENSDKSKQKKDPLLQISLRQSGPYFGLQQGRYLVGEIGGEMQWRKLRLKKPITHALTIGADYNLTQNILGLNTGYYYKGGRTKFSFGGNVVYRTDFTHNRIGLGPAIGYKLSAFHAQIGYVLLTPHETFVNTNSIYISLRFTLINERDFDVQTRWGKKKEKK
jgi:hypothetical protein